MRKVALVLFGSLLLGSCQTLSFYSQAIIGHSTLMLARRDAQAVIADPRTPSEVAERLRLAADLLRFAERHLALPVGDRYQSYVELAGSAPVWNVVIAPEFDTDPVLHCYPVAGCAPYRGYFSAAAAERYAAPWRTDHDVYVAPAAAYSTLGWFRRPDPVLVPALGGRGAGGSAVPRVGPQRRLHPRPVRFQRVLRQLRRRAGRTRLASAQRRRRRCVQGANRRRTRLRQLPRRVARSPRPALCAAHRRRCQAAIEGRSIPGDARRLPGEPGGIGRRSLRRRHGAAVQQCASRLAATYDAQQFDFAALFRAAGEDWATFYAMAKRGP